MEEKKWMNKPEIAKHFGVAINTIVSWVSKGLPEYRPGGGNPIYDLEEAVAWVKSNNAGENKGG